MLERYKRMYCFNARDRSNRGSVVDNRNTNQRPKEFKAVDNPINFNYKVSEAKTRVDSWKKYINIVGWILDIYGFIKTIELIFDIISIDEKKFEKDKYFGFDGTSYDFWPIIIVIAFLSLLENISYIYLGKKMK